jgi:hypothetical protein
MNKHHFNEGKHAARHKKTFKLQNMLGIINSALSQIKGREIRKLQSRLRRTKDVGAGWSDQ